MENILKCRFMRIVLRGKKHDYDPNYLLAAFEDFRSLLLTTSDGYQDYREKFRTMQNTHRLLKLHIQSDKFMCGHGENIKEFAEIALTLVGVEVDLLDKQIQYPDLFPLISKEPQRSPLYWNTSKYPKNSLISLITALDAVGVCTDSKGGQSSFIAIVKEFEYLFNTSLPNAYARRDELFSRRDSRVRFLRELVRSLGESDK